MEPFRGFERPRGMWRSLLLGVVLAGVLAGCGLGGGSGAGASGPTTGDSASAVPVEDTLVVTCDQIILRPTSPFADRYRRVLGVISVPPAYTAQIVGTPGQSWPYWEKAGLAVRANGVPVNVSVPPAWRPRAAIRWGNSGPAVSSLRIASCPSPPNVWNAYAGGFFLSSRGACVPLVFQIGQRRSTIRFGVGRRCSG